MTTNELKTLIASGDITKITFFGGYALGSDKFTWDVYAYGSKAAASFGNALKNSSREGGLKTYTSLDRAYTAMKNLGYKGTFYVDG